MFFLMHWPCAYCRLFFFKPKFVFTPSCPSRGSSGNPRAYWTVFFLPVKERLKEAPFMALEKIGQYPRDYNEWREKAAKIWSIAFKNVRIDFYKSWSIFPPWLKPWVWMGNRLDDKWEMNLTTLILKSKNSI